MQWLITFHKIYWFFCCCYKTFQQKLADFIHQWSFSVWSIWYHWGLVLYHRYGASVIKSMLAGISVIVRNWPRIAAIASFYSHPLYIILTTPENIEQHGNILFAEHYRRSWKDSFFVECYRTAWKMFSSQNTR